MSPAKKGISFLFFAAAIIILVGHFHRWSMSSPSNAADGSSGSHAADNAAGSGTGRRLADSLRLLQHRASKQHQSTTSGSGSAVQQQPAMRRVSTKQPVYEPTLLAPGQAQAFKIDPDRTKALPWYPSVWPKGTNETEVDVVNPDGSVEHHFSIRILKNQYPRVLRLQGVILPDEAAEIIKAAEKELGRSMVINHNFDKGGSEIHQVRTSFGMFLASPEQRALKANMALRRRIAKIMGIQEPWIEATQVLRYEAGQFYRSHNDFFDHNDHANMNRGGQRIASVVTWLNDVAEGGTTSFPMVGLKVAPKKGDSVLFYDADEEMREDPHSEHGGDPPAKGSVKWVAVHWCHPRTFV